MQSYLDSKNFTIEIDLEKLNDDFQGFCTEIDDRVFHVQIEKDYEMMTF